MRLKSLCWILLLLAPFVLTSCAEKKRIPSTKLNNPQGKDDDGRGTGGGESTFNPDFIESALNENDVILFEEKIVSARASDFECDPANPRAACAYQTRISLVEMIDGAIRQDIQLAVSNSLSNKYRLENSPYFVAHLSASFKASQFNSALAAFKAQQVDLAKQAFIEITGPGYRRSLTLRDFVAAYGSAGKDADSNQMRGRILPVGIAPVNRVVKNNFGEMVYQRTGEWKLIMSTFQRRQPPGADEPAPSNPPANSPIRVEFPQTRS